MTRWLPFVAVVLEEDEDEGARFWIWTGDPDSLDIISNSVGLARDDLSSIAGGGGGGGDIGLRRPAVKAELNFVKLEGIEESRGEL